MSDIVTVKNLKAYYKTNSFGVRRTVKAVDDISLNIKRGESYGIAGESGCGKTTLLKVMMGAHKNPLMIDEGFVKFSFKKNEKVISKDDSDRQEVILITIGNKDKSRFRYSFFPSFL